MAIRTIIGVQILSATLSMLFSRLDRSPFPDSILERFEPVITVSVLSAFAWPFIIAIIAFRKKEAGSSAMTAVFASILLALATWYCLFPAVS